MNLVLDACVAAKWFLPHRGETLVEEALAILSRFARGDIGLFVPDLFWPEVGNIFWKAARLCRMTGASAKNAIGSLAELNLPTSPSQGLLTDAFAIAACLDRTVYDSIYVALAVASGTTLVTADQRLVNAVAAHLPVRWLGSFAI